MNEIEHRLASLRCTNCGESLQTILSRLSLGVFRSHPVQCPKCHWLCYVNTELSLSISDQAILPVPNAA
jgi:predicted RNA-binding Zn-ribbon protein involved in translation (DUF1610 family)